MKKSTKIILIAIVALISIKTYGGDTTFVSKKELNFIIEEKTDDIRKDIIDLQKEEINIQQTNNEFSKRIDNLKFTEWLIGGIIGGGLALVLSLLFIPKYVKKQILKRVSESIGMEEMN